MKLLSVEDGDKEAGEIELVVGRVKINEKEEEVS